MFILFLLNSVVAIYFLALLFVLIITLLLYLKNKNKKRHDILIEEYNEKRILPLVELLHKYKLCTNSGIEWVIHSCTKSIEENISIKIFLIIKSFTKSIIFPIVAFFAGAMINFTDSVQLSTSLNVTLYFTLVFLGLIIALYPLQEQVVSNYTDLQTDILYIQTQNQYMEITVDSRIDVTRPASCRPGRKKTSLK